MRRNTEADILGRAERAPNGCLIWGGATFENGYGTVSYQGRQWRVHRLVWTLANGPIPPKLKICHACDVKACIELDHLMMGTQKSNITDAVAKGRMKGGRGVRTVESRQRIREAALRRWSDPVKRAEALASMQSPESREARKRASASRWADPDWSSTTRAKMTGPISPARGSGNSRAKLSEDDVRAVRQRVAAGETQRAVALAFGVSGANISDIIRRNIWTHI